MHSNSFGKAFSFTTFGESHGSVIGAVIDGCPSNLDIDIEFIQRELDRRKPGSSSLTTSRSEDDKVEILSGVFEGKSTGTPLALIIKNKDHHSADYDALKNVFRPSHADYVYDQKYGIRDHRGGGRSSARETAMRVAVGAIAKLILKTQGINIFGFVSQIGSCKMLSKVEVDYSSIGPSVVNCPDPHVGESMIKQIEAAKLEGDSLGGIVDCHILNCPIGLGEPIYDKLEADLAKAMMSINATRGFEIGSGFASATMKGSEHNDPFLEKDGKISTQSNFSGGIQGGISNGERIEFKVAFKPVASIAKEQKTVTKQGESIEFSITGRHDPCVVPRAVPIVEAMAAIVVVDHWLRARLNRL